MQQRGGHSSGNRRLSSSDLYPLPLESRSGQRDELQAHVVDTQPRDRDTAVELTASIIVCFDKDVRSVDTEKLFEVSI